MKDVKDKVAVVTGGASGIGRGMAQSFAEAGMKVVLSDIRDETLQATAEELRASGADVHTVVTDVADPQQVDALAGETISKYGAVHVLCNNAGIAGSGRFTWDSSLDDWKWIIGVNLMGVIHGLRSFVPKMIEQGTEAHVVNTASLAGLISGGGSGLYSVTKFGVVSLSESLYYEMQRTTGQVSVSVLCPGWVNTNILNNIADPAGAPSGTTPQSDDPLSKALMEWVGEELEGGLDPRGVGDQVLSAIQNNKFYVLTHPDWNYIIEQRMKDILSGSNPTPVMPPGFEKFLAKMAKHGVDMPGMS